MPSIEEKALLVGRVVDQGRVEDFEILVLRAVRTSFDEYRQGRPSEDEQYSSESYGESFIRYHKLGLISDGKVEELWMRAVLAGLHNALEDNDG